MSKTSMNIMRQGEERRITLTLNGCERSGHCETRELLSDFIRHELGVTVPTSAANTACAVRAPCISTASRRARV